MKQAFTTLSTLLLLSLGAAQAQDLTNAGALITLTGGATLSVTGSLTNTGSGELNLSSGSNQLVVGGNLVNATTAVLTPGTASTVTLNGVSAQQLDLNGASLANLTISNTSGGVRLPAGSNASVAGALTLTSTSVTTDPSATLTLLDGATLSGEQSGRYVKGNLAAVKANVPGGATTAFPNSFTLTPTTTLTNLRVMRRAGLTTAQVSYGTNASGNNQGIDRIWQTSAPVTGQVGLDWLPDDDNGRTNLVNSQVWARSAAPVAGSDWTRISNTQNGTGRSVTGTVPTGSNFAFFTVSTVDAPLPVTLVAFTAERQGEEAYLHWTTASELNNAYFEVESSVDGTNFRALAQVAGVGTSSQRHDYAFYDPSLAYYGAGIVYYRLRQVDDSGQASYSPVRPVVVPTATGWLVQAYPNPSPAATAITILVHTKQSGPVQVTLTDAVGRLLSQQTAELTPGSTSLLLPADLAAGVYALQVRQGAQQQTLKLVQQ